MKANILNTLSLQLLNCQILGLFFVSCDNKLNSFGLKVLIGQNKQYDIILCGVFCNCCTYIYDSNNKMRE